MHENTFLDKAVNSLDLQHLPSIKELFNNNAHRFEEFSLRHDSDILCDFSKTHLCKDSYSTLIKLAQDCRIEEKIHDLFNGKKVNISEGLPALHTALRSHSHSDEIKKSYMQMARFCQDVRQGNYKSFNGKPFTDIVHIGIGGSHIATQMTIEALKPYHNGPHIHYLTNIDATTLLNLYQNLDFSLCLFVISSKTFHTLETLQNARTIKQILHQHYPNANIEQNIIALCSNTQKQQAQDLGIRTDNIFTSFDWVGGRYSIWSSQGLTLMMAIGEKHFKKFLDGAHAIDTHFKTTPIANNIPIILALIDIWHRSFCGYNTRIILPYSDRLQFLPRYLQQLVMESNGKTIDKNGNELHHSACSIIFGEIGTQAQHSIFQYLYQGHQIIPCEFYIHAENMCNDYPDYHTLLMANALAQVQTLAFGGSQTSALYKRVDGNRPCVMLLYKTLSPFILGKIMAINEHRTFAEGCIYNINSFDQNGVEESKKTAKHMHEQFNNLRQLGEKFQHTASLIEAIQDMCNNGK